MHKTIPTDKDSHTLNANVAVAMKVPRVGRFVEFQGVIEQNISYSPKYLINQLKNYDKYILI